MNQNKPWDKVILRLYVFCKTDSLVYHSNIYASCKLAMPSVLISSKKSKQHILWDMYHANTLGALVS